MKSNIPGVMIWEQPVLKDERGYLVELFRKDMLEAEHLPAMAYVSATLPGIMRGPHLHDSQTDLFIFQGNFRLYLIDENEIYGTIPIPGSPYGEYLDITCDQSYRTAVLVPPGIVHAYKNTGDEVGLVFNAPNRLYAGTGKRYAVDEERLEKDESFMKIFNNVFGL